MARISRDEAAVALALAELEAAPPQGAVLVVEDPQDDLAQAVRRGGGAVESWHRRAGPGRIGAPWPPPGPFELAAIRLPKAKDEMEMALHAAASVVRPGGRIWLYGAKDEGIRSAARRVEPLLGRVATLAVGGHARLLEARRPEVVPDLRDALRDWRGVFELDTPWGRARWVSYPGAFAHGRLDAGTALLLRNLPPLRDDARVLDYGAGTGILAAGVLHASPASEVVLLEPDAVAAEAARENVPAGTVVVGAGWADAPAGRFDAIVSNPPYHQGKRETLAEVEALVAGSRAALAGRGVLRFVVQRRLPVEALLASDFRRVEVVADEGPYRVWEAAVQH